MSKVHVLWSSALGALTNLAPTISALLLLSVQEFGMFAVLYAIFALGWSISLSVVCDAFLRGPKDDHAWADYSSTLVGLSTIFMLVAIVISLVVYPDVLSASLAAGAIGLGIYRLGARFFRSYEFSAASVLGGDAWNLSVFLVVFVGAMASGVSEVTSHSAAWISAGVVSIIIAPPHRSNPWRALLRWSRQRWKTIRMLLSDSLLMDCGAIVGPLLLLPGLGINGFGVYRGVSSVASPVQLLLDPIRPHLARMSRDRRSGLNLIVAVVGAGLMMAGACFIILLSLSYFRLVQGTLAALAAFALPCSIFVFTNFLGHFYYLLSRAHSSAKKIHVGRFVQTVLTMACPLVGVAVLGLQGAIWGFVGATLLSSVTWASLMLTSPGD